MVFKIVPKCLSLQFILNNKLCLHFVSDTNGPSHTATLPTTERRRNALSNSQPPNANLPRGLDTTILEMVLEMQNLLDTNGSCPISPSWEPMKNVLSSSELGGFSCHVTLLNIPIIRVIRKYSKTPKHFLYCINYMIKSSCTDTTSQLTTTIHTIPTPNSSKSI